MSARDVSEGQSPGHVRIGPWERSWTDAEYAAAVEDGARGDRARRRLPGQPRPASERRARGLAGRARGAARPVRAPDDGRRGLGDRLRLAGALPRPPRPPRLDVPDQGHAAARGERRGGEGLGRARDDRRPGAKRPLARLRAGLGALAGADGGARAGRGHPPRLDRRGHAARGRRARGAARGDVPGRIGDRRAEDRRARPDRRARAGRPGRLDGRARHRARATATSTSRSRSAPSRSREGRIHLWVGGGIVWDSDPEAEIEESWTKARPLLAAIGAPVEANAR